MIHGEVNNENNNKRPSIVFYSHNNINLGDRSRKKQKLHTMEAHKKCLQDKTVNYNSPFVKAFLKTKFEPKTINIGGWKCSRCSSTFNYLIDYISHLDKTKYYLVKIYKCCYPDCVFSFIGFDYQSYADKHIKRHKKKKDKKCDYCHYTTDSNGNLQRHIESHLKQKLRHTSKPTSNQILNSGLIDINSSPISSYNSPICINKNYTHHNNNTQYNENTFEHDNNQVNNNHIPTYAHVYTSRDNHNNSETQNNQSAYLPYKFDPNNLALNQISFNHSGFYSGLNLRFNLYPNITSTESLLLENNCHIQPSQKQTVLPPIHHIFPVELGSHVEEKHI
ncbi:uncharacterized protein ASCRUDRAFT_75473 [Ascoidea rubescens DSM 1968]|uniref:C2H2-type domain-containing protein n=1 Tax=Ascoidea rubescens DSM 1968 TaxID=1344418 RepID=A0A1D2VIW3_9ASCO|nr:hypothetical protein ASCRUDRAFT_75473 [Ascoidea rubescens DSM 1968]ODV61463.1 hypothetical protein ASCRUDRAFT_75473 [Ascoidea rubescens DSM 1968]